MKKNQRSIQKPVEFEGTGLFSGQRAKLRLLPAPPNSGVTFVRTDLPARPRIPVNPDTVTCKLHRSAVSGENAEVETIEHLMSAIGGLELDNLDLEIDASEVPNADGCSRPFVEILRSAGIVEQPEPRRTHVIREPIAVTENDASVVALPGNGGLTVTYSLNYPNTPIGQQHLTLDLTDEAYARQISPARTFCLESEAQAMVQQGIAKGGDYENTVVWGPAGPIKTTLRFPDEPVRHKILDLLGDLATLGAGLRAHLVAVKSGHSTNLKLVKRIAAAFEGGDQAAPAKTGSTLLDVREIAKILPHRYPFLLVDKVVELDGYRRAVGIKNVSFNEPFFQGHFPGQPIMPGVLQIEAMAQLAGVLLMRKSDNQARVAVLLSLDGVKLRKSVVPGDQLRIEVETIKVKARTGEVFARATVDGALVAEANMKFMLMDGTP
jgi:UDP-3-O-[3-hydroxymyristoyl] N-acetylglucosamine deacetylase/3-hydroxyacyl-[acyl-carrier-protein] dehydratase